MWYHIFLVVFILFAECQSQLSKDKDELLNWCLDAENHKKKPGKESSLYDQCIPWTSHSCCTENTTVQLHSTVMYNFNYDHCKDQVGVSMSEKCRRHFVQDHCFYECEPNIGYWVVKTKRKIGNERFKHVPLCSVDCDSWWNACKSDYTCAYNWPHDFDFKGGHNTCKEGASCVHFHKVYKNASDFCENVWNHSWKVVSNKEPCMRIWFNGTLGNPNRQVAEYFVNTYVNGSSIKLPFTLLLILVLTFVHVLTL